MSRLRVAVALVACVLGGLSSATSAHARVPWLGVMADGPLTEPGERRPGEWDRLAASGVGFVRVAFYWSEIEPEAPGRMDWTATDRLVRTATRRGVGVLPVVLRAPAWAARPAPPADGTPYETLPRRRSDYAAVLVRLIRRYGTAGSFWREHPDLPRRPLRAWQIWNEPNLGVYWPDLNWAGTYVPLLKTAYRAIKREDPGATVVTGGLADDSDYAIRALYGVGAKGYFDVAAVHAYAPGSGLVDRLRRFRQAMRDAGDAGKPIWLTEFGRPTAIPDRDSFGNTPRQQAAQIRDMLTSVAAVRRRYGVARAILYTWASRPNGVDWPTYAGLRRMEGDRLVSMPAYRVFVRTVRRLAGRPSS